MNGFSYTRAGDVAGAVSEVSGNRAAKFIAGGTNLIDLMKENVARPGRLVDITRLPLNRIEDIPDGGFRLGALVTNADTAYNEQVEMRYPLLSRAILSGASPPRSRCRATRSRKRGWRWVASRISRGATLKRKRC